MANGEELTALQKAAALVAAAALLIGGPVAAVAWAIVENPKLLADLVNRLRGHVKR